MGMRLQWAHWLEADESHQQQERQQGDAAGRHLQVRCSQRNVTPGMVDLVLAHGTFVPDREGWRVYVSRHSLAALAAEGLSEAEARKLGSLLVILGPGGEPVTVYHASPAKRRTTRRLWRNVH
jgi:hypothetical protein